MMLIIATQSPFSKQLPAQKIAASLILTQDAVIAIANQAIDFTVFDKVYALDSDIVARGLCDQATQHPHIERVNLAQFVQLTANHHPIMNW